MTGTDNQPMTVYSAKLLQMSGNLASEEWLNIGVILLDDDRGELHWRIQSTPLRALSAWPDLDAGAVRNLITMIADRAAVVASGEDLPSDDIDRIADMIVRPQGNWRWGTTRYGVTGDAATRMEELYWEYVERHPRPVSGAYKQARGALQTGRVLP